MSGVSAMVILLAMSVILAEVEETYPADDVSVAQQTTDAGDGQAVVRTPDVIHKVQVGTMTVRFKDILHGCG